MKTLVHMSALISAVVEVEILDETHVRVTPLAAPHVYPDFFATAPSYIDPQPIIGATKNDILRVVMNNVARVASEEANKESEITHTTEQGNGEDEGSGTLN
jgi:hypothetical protein